MSRSARYPLPIVAALALALAACGGGTGNDAQPSSTPPPTASESATPSTEASTSPTPRSPFDQPGVDYKDEYESPKVENLRFYQNDAAVFSAFEVTTPQGEDYRFAQMDITYEYLSDGAVVDTRPDSRFLGQPGEEITVINILVVPYRAYDVDEVKVSLKTTTSIFRNDEKDLFSNEKISTTEIKPGTESDQIAVFQLTNSDSRRSPMQNIEFSCDTSNGDFIFASGTLHQNPIEPGATAAVEAPIIVTDEIARCDATVMWTFREMPDLSGVDAP